MSQGTPSVDAINKRLQQEEEWLRNFKGEVERSAELRDGIEKIIDNFEQRLALLEKNVLPMHTANGRLQIKQRNVQRLINTIDATIQFYGKTSQLETMIRDGSPSLNLNEYLDNMESLQQAIMFFENHPSYQSQTENMKMTLEMGFAVLEKEYKNTLQRNTVQADLRALHDSLDGQYELIPSKAREIKTVKNIDEIAKLGVWLLERGRSGFLNSYSEIRGDAMQRIISSVLHHMQNLAISTNPKAAALKNALKKSKAETSERKTADTSMAMNPEDGALLILGCLLALLEVEEEVMRKTIPDTSKRAQVSREVVSKPLSFVVRNVQKVVQEAQSGVAALLPLLRFLVAHQTRLHNLATNSLGDIPFEQLVRTVRVNASSQINEFVEGLRNDLNKFVPVDGNVHPLTANTLNFLVMLTTYRHVVTQQLLTMTAAQGENHALLLPKLFARILSALGMSLKRKAENYDDPTLSTIFLLNNYQYIAKTLTDDKEALLPVISEQNSQILSFYEAEIAKCIQQYMTSWNSSIATLNASDRDDRGNTRNIISSFTREFDQVCSMQRVYCISDAKLVTDVRDRVKKALVPSYSSLMDRLLMAGSVSDRPPKYTVDSLISSVDRLFDVTA